MINLNKPCILSNKCLSHGYPRIKINNVYVYEHRYVLENKLGRPLYLGFETCHKCGTKNCIEPDHLYEGTHKQNMRDLLEKGNTNFFGQNQRKITHCPQGHEYSGDNLIYDNNTRKCKICCNKRSLQNYYKRKVLKENKRVAI